MMITAEYWYLLPISVMIATVAMTSGIGGAVFFAPIFMIGIRLEPSVAVGTALITELFGVGSGVLAYWRRRLIDMPLARQLLVFSVPAAVLGSLGADAIPSIVLRTAFGVGVIFIGSQLYLSLSHEEVDRLGDELAADTREPGTVLTDSAGREYRYTVTRPDQGRVFAAVGGAFLGAISVGLAELQEYHLMARCRVPPPVAVATSLFVVLISVVAASVGHAYHFATAADPDTVAQVAGIIAFTVPGVVIGGQIGPFVQARANPDHVKRGISMVFIAVGVFMLVTIDR